MADQVQDSVDHEPANFLRERNSQFIGLPAGLINIHINFSFQRVPSFRHRETQDVSDIPVTEKLVIQSEDFGIVDKDNGTLGLSDTFSYKDPSGSPDDWLTGDSIVPVRVQHTDFVHFFLRLGDFPLEGNSDSVNESAMPESMTSGPSWVKFPERIERSTLE